MTQLTSWADGVAHEVCATGVVLFTNSPTRHYILRFATFRFSAFSPFSFSPLACSSLSFSSTFESMASPAAPTLCALRLSSWPLLPPVCPDGSFSPGCPLWRPGQTVLYTRCQSKWPTNRQASTYGYLLPVLLVIGDRASVSSRFDGVYCAPVVSVPGLRNDIFISYSYSHADDERGWRHHHRRIRGESGW